MSNKGLDGVFIRKLFQCSSWVKTGLFRDGVHGTSLVAEVRFFWGVSWCTVRPDWFHA